MAGRNSGRSGDPAILQELGHPLAVAFIAFAAVQCFYLLGIGQNQMKSLTFQNITGPQTSAAFSAPGKRPCQGHKREGSDRIRLMFAVGLFHYPRSRFHPL